VKLPFPLALVLLFPALSVLVAQEADLLAAVIPGQRGTVRFTESPPQSSDPIQVRYRLMAAEDPPPYDVTQESYEILLPAAYEKKRSQR